MSQAKTTEQEIYDSLLKDDRLRCTCDEVVREESFFQAQGHYHHCMLYQVTRAIELSTKRLEAQLRRNERMRLIYECTTPTGECCFKTLERNECVLPDSGLNARVCMYLKARRID